MEKFSAMVLLLLLASWSARSQEPLENNYIREEQFFASVRDDRSAAAESAARRVRFTYIDGLGREVQQVSAKRSPSGNDVVTFRNYDRFGRETRRYLPFTVAGNGLRRSDPLSEQLQFYSVTDAVVRDHEPYSILEHDGIPGGSIRKAFAAGWSWHHDTESVGSSHATKLNRADEVRALLHQPATNLISYFPSSFVPAGVLTIEEEVKESGLISRIYRDYRGLVVLRRAGENNRWRDTYYVNDHAGRVAIVVPPEAVARLSFYFYFRDKQVFLDQYCYQYRYDNYGRLIQKKVPQKGWEYFVYDKWDRIVLRQDANLRKEDKWVFTKYDAHNRPVITGTYRSTYEDAKSLAASAVVRFEQRADNSVGYTNNAFPPHSEASIFTITYYDCYNFIGYNGWDSEKIDFAPATDSGMVDLGNTFVPGDPGGVFSPVVRGYATGTKVRVMSGDRWLNSVTYYDKNYRVVQTVTENVYGKGDRVSVEYHPFNGKPVRKRMTHAGPGTSLTVVERFAYDGADRLLEIHHRIAGQAEILMVRNRYNELGQLVEKNIHSEDGKTFLQSVDFRYNVQGWLTHINRSTLERDDAVNDDWDDLFGMEVLYNDGVALDSGKFTTARHYDGNVSAIRWKNAGAGETEKIYGFATDRAGRFLKAHFASKTPDGWLGSNGLFNEEVSAYDLNGNVAGTTPGLVRTGDVGGMKAVTDRLTYRLHHNQVYSIVDSGLGNTGFIDKAGGDLNVREYAYDDNGNLVEDFNRSISGIRYNHLNLLEELVLTRAEFSPVRRDRISFEYDAAGGRLGRKIELGDAVVWNSRYAGNVQYDNGALSFFDTPEGRAVFNGDDYDYEYFFKDFQGNVRLVYGRQKDTQKFLATLEPSRDEKEGSEFANIAVTRAPGNNATAASSELPSPAYSARCNGYGSAAAAVGPAKSLSVKSGDVVYAEVFARFNHVKTTPATLVPAILAAGIATTFGVTAGESPGLHQAFTNSAPLIAVAGNSDPAVPVAYLAFICLDRNFAFRKIVVHRISERAYRAHERLSISLKADMDGYVFAFVANQSVQSADADVYFDDLLVIHQKAGKRLRILQRTDYYPFGRTFNEFNAERLVSRKAGGGTVYERGLWNRYLFQGQESHRDLGLEYHAFRFRFYDPASGRFLTTDPLAEDYYHNSTYAFSENKLIHGVELEGLEFKQLFNAVKYFSPVAINPHLSMTSHDARIGIEVSIGFPKMLPFSYRREYGVSASFTDLLQQNHVFQTKAAVETSALFGNISFQSTRYASGATTQTTGMLTLGNPLVNIQYENDWFPQSAMRLLDFGGFHPQFGGDGGDRFRSAALSAQVGLFNAGFKLATGDPGLFEGNRLIDYSLGRYGVYVPGRGSDPDRYRLGLAYGGLGGLRLGINSDLIRHGIQNRLVHDNGIVASPWFRPLPQTPALYFGYSTDSSTLW